MRCVGRNLTTYNSRPLTNLLRDSNSAKSGLFNLRPLSTASIINLDRQRRKTYDLNKSTICYSQKHPIISLDWAKWNKYNLNQSAIYYSQKHPMRPVYKGPIQAAILDWSGTTADAFVDSVRDGIMFTMAHFCIKVNNLQARKPMGPHKKKHFFDIFQDPDVQNQWLNIYYRLPTMEGHGCDLDMVFEFYETYQVSLLEKPGNKYTRLLPGTATTVNILRKDFGMKIGSTTGFTRKLSVPILKDAKEQGYVPDVEIAADELPRTRPYFDGIVTNAL